MLVPHAGMRSFFLRKAKPVGAARTSERPPAEAVLPLTIRPAVPRASAVFRSTRWVWARRPAVSFRRLRRWRRMRRTRTRTRSSSTRCSTDPRCAPSRQPAGTTSSSIRHPIARSPRRSSAPPGRAPARAESKSAPTNCTGASSCWSARSCLRVSCSCAMPRNCGCTRPQRVPCSSSFWNCCAERAPLLNPRVTRRFSVRREHVYFVLTSFARRVDKGSEPV